MLTICGVVGGERDDLHRAVEADQHRADDGRAAELLSSLVEIEAEWNAGMISTLAGPDRRQNG